MRALSDNGHADLAYTLATQRSYPSWGYMIDKGATTFWELWNGDTADPAMDSGNHVMAMGDVAQWLNEDLAGIRPDEAHPGFKHIIFHPMPLGDLAWVSATHRSPYGTIASGWQRDGSRLSLSLVIPPNTTATLEIPLRPGGVVMEGDQPADRSIGVKLIREGDGSAVFDLSSGSYSFGTVMP